LIRTPIATPSQSSGDPDRNGLEYRTNCIALGDLRATNTEADKQGYGDCPGNNPCLHYGKEDERQDRDCGREKVCKQHPERLLQGI
jgi:hypothetical protein